MSLPHPLWSAAPHEAHVPCAATSHSMNIISCFPSFTLYWHLGVDCSMMAIELEQYECQFNMNCTDFTIEDFKFFNRLRNITALICAAITLAILLFLICQKAFSSLFQRLYFYLVIGTLLTEIAVGLNIEHQWHYQQQETVCVWLGLMDLHHSVRSLL